MLAIPPISFNQLWKERLTYRSFYLTSPKNYINHFLRFKIKISFCRKQIFLNKYLYLAEIKNKCA